MGTGGEGVLDSDTGETNESAIVMDKGYRETDFELWLHHVTEGGLCPYVSTSTQP
jgi:hypothetical protein